MTPLGSVSVSKVCNYGVILPVCLSGIVYNSGILVSQVVLYLMVGRYCNRNCR